MTRQEKLALIESTNPTWEDLAADLPEVSMVWPGKADPPPSAKDDKGKSSAKDGKGWSGVVDDKRKD